MKNPDPDLSQWPEPIDLNPDPHLCIIVHRDKNNL